MNALTLLLRQEMQPTQTRLWLERHSVTYHTGDSVLVKGYFDTTPENTSPYYKVSLLYTQVIIEVVGEAMTTILSTHFQYPLAYQKNLQQDQHLRLFKMILPDLTDLYYAQTLDTDMARLAVDPFSREDGGTH